MVLFIRLVLGLLVLAGAMSLSPAGTVAQDTVCSSHQDTASMQSALRIAPELAPVLDPDGNGIACDHEEGVIPGEPTAGSLQIPSLQTESRPPLTLPTETAIAVAPTTAPQQTNLLEGRLGASQAAFAAVHGAVIEEILDETNPAVTLNVYTPPPTAFDLYTFDLNGQVVAVVVVAETSWTPDQAAGLILNYLPADVLELPDAEPLADGTLLMPAFSQDLASGISAETMTAFGIPGTPGDLYLQIFPNDMGDVVEMEIGVGNGDDIREEAMSLTDPSTQTAPTTAEDASVFLTETRAEVDRLQSEIEAFAAIINADTFSEAESDQVADIIIGWLNIDTSLPAAPPAHSAMAQQLQQIRLDMSEVGLDLTLFLAAPEEGDLTATGDLLTQIELSLDDLDRQLTELGF